MRILNAEPTGYSTEATQILEGLGTLQLLDADRAQLLAALSDSHVVVVRLRHTLDREVLDAAPCLRVIVSPTTGLDHIDVAEATQRGIHIISLRGESAFLNQLSATAEHTWALLLALCRRVPAAVHSVRRGEWTRDVFRGRELAGRTIGLLGMGRIGRMVAEYARAFGMTVLGFDPDATEWPGHVKRVEDLESLFRHADIVSIHVSLNASTTGLIGSRELAWLRPDALLINTARGAVLDEAALAVALRSNALAGAAVDVIDHEREPARRLASPLIAYAREHDNLLVTPHIGGATHESMARAELFVAQKLREFVRESSATTKAEIPVR